MTNETILLNNGTRMPVIGYGATIIPRGDGKIRGNELAVKQWKMYEYLSNEYSNLLYDISPSYGLCEYVLGNVIQNVGKRDNMYIALKISNYEQRQGNIRDAFERHLDKLKVDYVDLAMLHWPYPDRFVDSYHVLEEMYAAGKAKAIGVSNFHQHHFEELMQHATIVPAVNQIEVHPLFTQEPLREYCESIGTKVLAYSPLGRMHDVLMKHKVLKVLMAKYGKTAPQLILRWDIQCGMGTIPRTLSKEHFAEVMEILNFELEEEDVKAISAMNENIRLRFNPDTIDYEME